MSNDSMDTGNSSMDHSSMDHSTNGTSSHQVSDYIVYDLFFGQGDNCWHMFFVITSYLIEVR